jgi:hypothetical protein
LECALDFSAGDADTADLGRYTGYSTALRAVSPVRLAATETSRNADVSWRIAGQPPFKD